MDSCTSTDKNLGAFMATSRHNRHSNMDILECLMYLICCSFPLVGGVQTMNSVLKPSVLICNRIGSLHVECEFTSAGILFEQKTRISPLVSAQYQVIRARYSDESDQHLFILNTSSKRISIHTEFQGTEISQEVNKVNSFIADSGQKTIVVRQDDSWHSFQRIILFVLGLISALIGGSMTALTIFESFSPDKSLELLEEECRSRDCQKDQPLTKGQEQALRLATSLCQSVKDGNTTHERLAAENVRGRTIIVWNYTVYDSYWGIHNSRWIPIGMDSSSSATMQGCILSQDEATAFMQFCQHNDIN
jgi:hypothetical protein